jgi:hypothetical protein
MSNGTKAPRVRRPTCPGAIGWMILIGLGGPLAPATAQGQWIEPPGSGWADLTLYHQSTRHQFDRDGEHGRLLNGGHAVTTSVFLTGAVGLVRGVDTWIQLPVHRLRYDDFGGNRSTVGLGDPRIFLRVGPEAIGLPAFPVAIRGGVKWPGGDFDIDAEVIPLGDGQRDVELLMEGGFSLHPRSMWGMGWVGYRWRGPNAEAARDPGDERFAYAALGGSLGRLGWKAAMEEIRGDPWRIHGLLIPSTPRELRQGFVSVDWPVGSGRLGAGFRTPLAGRNMPAGTAFSLHYFRRWSQE